MADPVVANVILGGAKIWYAPVGEANPDDSVAFGADWAGNWARVGYTSEPCVIIYEDERVKIKVQEHLGAIKDRRIDESLMIETKLAELKMEYLALAMDGTITTTAPGAGQVGKTELKGGDQWVISRYKWGVEGEYVDANGASFPLRLYIHIGTAKVNGNIEFDAHGDSEAGIPFQIDAFPDHTQAAGETLYHWEHVTAAATS